MNTQDKIITLAMMATLAVLGFWSGHATGSGNESCQVATETASELFTGPVSGLMSTGEELSGLIPQAYEAGLARSTTLSESLISKLEYETATNEDNINEFNAMYAKFKKQSENC